MSATQRGVPHTPADKEARKAMGLVIWEDGESFRPGKTRREWESGVKTNYLHNREERREVNRNGPSKK